MNNNIQLLTFNDSSQQGDRLAKRLDIPHLSIDLHCFPDGESLITLPTELNEHVILYRSLNQPNEKITELILVSKTLRQRGVKRITLIAPYLCYMRQDIENHPGEVVSQKIIGQLFGGLFDDVITVDSHLHRISKLNEAIPLKNAINILATDPIVEFLHKKFDELVILGPDSESKQWVEEIANKIGCQFAVANKQRTGDKEVKVTLPDHNFKNKNIVIVDDMASTGRTISLAAAQLNTAGAQTVNALVTHALFMGDAKQFLIKNGVTSIWSTDTISDETNVIALDKIIADTFRQIVD